MDKFYGCVGPHDADIAIIGESWGKEEELKGRPFVGQSGDLLTSMLNEAGIDRSTCFITNVCPRHPPGNHMEHFFFTLDEVKANHFVPYRGLYPHPETIEDIKRLHSQLQEVCPRVIIACGNYALWALTNVQKIKNLRVKVQNATWKTPVGITAWRGSQLPLETCAVASNPWVIPIVHPAGLLPARQPELRQPTIHDLRVRVFPIANGIVQESNYDFIVRPTYQQVLDFIFSEISLGKRRWSIDLETRGGHIACVCLATSASKAISIPFMCVERPTGYFTIEQEGVIRGALVQLLSDPTIQIVGQNYNYDRQYLLYWLFVRSRCHLDTMIAHHLCFPGTPRGLSYLASLYCRYYRYWKDEGKEWDDSMPEEQLWRYNCIDGVTAWEISHVLETVVQNLDLTEQLQEQMESVDLAFEMMTDGILIDKKERARLVEEVMNETLSLDLWFDKVMPQHLLPLLKGKGSKASTWYTSPAQQCRFFYDLMGIEEVRDPKTRARTMDDDALMKIKVREPLLAPICDKLQDSRSLGIFMDMLTAKLELTGRVSCYFDPSGTSTFRWNSKKNAFGRGLNLQTIPKGED